MTSCSARSIQHPSENALSIPPKKKTRREAGSSIKRDCTYREEGGAVGATLLSLAGCNPGITGAVLISPVAASFILMP